MSFHDLREAMVSRFAALSGQKLFKVRPNIPPGTTLSAVYLDAFPPELRQEHNCKHCLNFIERFGALSSVTCDGDIIPVFWAHNMCGGYYGVVSTIMQKVISSGRVSGPFISNEPEWGVRENTRKASIAHPIPAIFEHLAITPPLHQCWHSKGATIAGQEARWQEDMTLLRKALARYSHDHAKQALALVELNILPNSNKISGPARWFVEAHAIKGLPERRTMHNKLWAHVASAPEGWAHINTTMLGTVLEDLKAGTSGEDLVRKYASRTSGVNYQRPKAAPTIGAIDQAEREIEALGLSSAFLRRPAGLAEVMEFAIWAPKATTSPEQENIFSTLRGAHSTKALELSSGSEISWERFAREVLPRAQRIEMNVPDRGNFRGITTAVYDEAPPILQWDKPDARHRFSSYVYDGGSYARQWNIEPGWHSVCGVVSLPPFLNKQSWHNDGVVFLLAGMQEHRNTQSAIFPAQLISSLHKHRSVVEAISASRPLSKITGDWAAGLGLDLVNTQATLRVTIGTMVVSYKIDRWQ